VVIDVPDVWGMFLSRKFVATLDGTLQMDLTYANIPMDDETNSHLPNLPMEKDHMNKLTLKWKLRIP
jgi:hypothetical protein